MTILKTNNIESKQLKALKQLKAKTKIIPCFISFSQNQLNKISHQEHSSENTSNNF